MHIIRSIHKIPKTEWCVQFWCVQTDKTPQV